MKRNWIVISLMFLLTAALWAQVGTTANPPAGDKATACACCNHQAKAGDAATSDCCGKDGMACARKGGKGCCDGMKGMKKDAAQTTTAASSCGKDCCGKDCCKDGKCEMAKNGKKCCDHSPATTEGK